MPQRAAGWRMEPPVSVPMPRTACPAATAAADPPEEPPGTRSVSHGLRVGPKPEFSVDEPMANSSMLVLPSTTTPARRSRSTTVASYGGRNSSRIFDPAVVRTPLVTSTSLSASGTPASGPSGSPRSLAASTSAASCSACSPVTVRNAFSRSLVARMRWRADSVAATAVASPAANRAASSWAVRSARFTGAPPCGSPDPSRSTGAPPWGPPDPSGRGGPGGSRLLLDDPRDHEAVLLHLRGGRQRLLAGQAGSRRVVAPDVDPRQRVGGRGHALGR